MPMGFDSDNSLAPYSLSFGTLNILQEYGLLISESVRRPFSRCGSEFLSVVDIKPNEESTKAMKSFFDGKG